MDKKVNGKSYIGSSINLGKRLSNYYSFNYLVDPKNKMLITKALLKYGYSNFSLEILEYCSKSDLITREQFYFYNLKPEYNILTKAKSSLGFKHSEKTKLKMSIKSQDHLDKIRGHLKNLILSHLLLKLELELAKVSLILTF